MFIKARERFSRGEYWWNHEIEKLTHVSCVIDFLFIHLLSFFDTYDGDVIGF